MVDVVKLLSTMQIFTIYQLCLCFVFRHFLHANS